MGAVGIASDGTFEASELTADDADMVTEVQGFGSEGHGSFGMIEHEAEGVHLGIRDDCERMAPVAVGLGCLVGQEKLNVRIVLEDLEALIFIHMDENDAWNDNARDFALMAVAIDMSLFLAGYIGFDA